MKHLMTYEKLIKYQGDLDIGNGLADGLIGCWIKLSKPIDNIIKYLNFENIDYKLLLNSNTFLLILTRNEEALRLPLVYVGDEYTLTDHYLPTNDDGGGLALEWFYKDILDEGDWEEVIIKDNNDMLELHKEIKIRIEASKYNI